MRTSARQKGEERGMAWESREVKKTDEERERDNGVAFAKNNSYISRVYETGLRRAEK